MRLAYLYRHRRWWQSEDEQEDNPWKLSLVEPLDVYEVKRIVFTYV